MQTPCVRFSGQAPGIRSRSLPFIQVSGARYRVPGVGYRLSGTGYRIPGAGFAPRAEHRAPKTEPNAHTGYASCILHPVSCIHT